MKEAINTSVICCDKTFVLKWRLRKHLEGHSKDCGKFCHYFNNEKVCPFEKIGCKFLHKDSEVCYFGRKCRNKLCQYKHIHNDTEEVIEGYLVEMYNNLKTIEKKAAREVLCDFYCKRAYDYHRCSEETYQEFIGCDVFNITDDFVIMMREQIW